MAESERNLQMKNLLKIFFAVAVIFAAISLASCGSGTSNPDDAEGSLAGIKWSYTKSDHTLTVSGSGDIPGFAGSEDVPWYDVRSAVEKIKFEADEGESFSAIGDYTFYGMTALKEVEIPDGVMKLGDCAFAFCSALEKVRLPDTLTAIGDSAFEVCSSLKSIEIPSGTLNIGESAFAFCRALTSVTVSGRPEQIKKWTFRDCAALESFRMDTEKTEFDDDAFAGANITQLNAKSIHTSVVSVVCKDENGNTIGGDASAAVLDVGEDGEVKAPSIDGYELAAGDTQSVVGTGDPISVEFIYKKLVEEGADETEQITEAPTADDADGDEDGGVEPMTIVAIVIFAVVIVGIAVGSFLLIRSDKKTTKDSMTVRKNGDKNGKKNGSKNGKKGKKK